MSRTLPAARAAFVAAMKRDTSGPELPRLVAVLDALIKWSNEHPRQLAFKTDESQSSVLSFERVDTKAVFWSVRTVRGDAPKLEIYPPTGRGLVAANREKVRETLNAHSRETLAERDRLRIGFGALKNIATRAPVLAMLEELMASEVQTLEVSA